MKLFFFAFIAFLYMGCSENNFETKDPITQELQNKGYLSKNEILVGDMVIPIDELLDESDAHTSGASTLGNSRRLWPDGVLPLRFSSNFSSQMIQDFNESLCGVGEIRTSDLSSSQPK